jgi:hypothetical protein
MQRAFNFVPVALCKKCGATASHDGLHGQWHQDGQGCHRGMESARVSRSPTMRQTCQEKIRQVKSSEAKRPASARRARTKGKRLACLWLPSWVSLAKERCYLPRGRSLDGAGPQKVWRLRVSDIGWMELPRECLDLAGYWPGDELRLCVGFIPGNGVATNTDGNAIVIQIVPHGWAQMEIESAARRSQRQMDQARKAGRLVPFVATEDGPTGENPLTTGAAKRNSANPGPAKSARRIWIGNAAAARACRIRQRKAR